MITFHSVLPLYKIHSNFTLGSSKKFILQEIKHLIFEYTAIVMNHVS